MAARDSDDDIRKYMPDLKTILRGADPKVAAATRRKALDAPEVAEAIAELREDNEVTQPIGVVAVVSASPWGAAGAGAGAIDKAALPSALVPTAAPPVVRDAVESTPKTQGKKRKKEFPLWATGGAAVLAVVGPVTLAVVLLGRPGQQGGVTVPSAATTGLMSSGAVVPRASTAPLATQAPNAPSARSVESAVPVPSVSAVAPPAVVPTVRPKVGRQVGDPSNAASPLPAKTVEAVTPPPVPSQQPSALPAPGKSPIEGDRVFGN